METANPPISVNVQDIIMWVFFKLGLGFIDTSAVVFLQSGRGVPHRCLVWGLGGFK